MTYRFSPQKHLAQQVARFFYWTSAFILLLAGALLWNVAAAGFERMFSVGLVVALALAAAFVVSATLLGRGHMRAGIGVALVAIALGAIAAAVASGRGLQTVLLSGLGIVVLVSAIVIGRRAAAWIAAGSGIALLALYFAGANGMLPASPAPMPLPNLLFAHLLLLGLGALFGWMATAIVESAAQETAEREQRFRALLGIASDWYWEQDTQFRFTKALAWNRVAGVLDEADVLGKTRWELPHSDVSAEQWAAHRALLRERRPFRNFVLRSRQIDGRADYLSVSGEPMFAPDGEFIGYWGIGRGVTAEVEAQRALEASERRYRDLFDRTPTPLVIHRSGVVVLANRAAASLFGYANARDMAGIDLIEHTPPELHDLVGGRVAQLETMRVGEELPVTDLRVVGRDGSIRHAQATGVRVSLLDGPATMSIYFDITERVRADVALRRSEQILSHLFESSPDAIVVSEIETSRVLMINSRFEALFGFRRQEIVGRRSLDLDLWVDAADRVRLVEALKRDGAAHGVPVRRRAKDGRVVSVLYSAARMQIEGHDYFVGSMRDVTASEQARMRQEAILNNASIGIAFTHNRVFQLANPEFEAMFGWSPGTLTGQPGSVVWRSAEDYAEIGRIAGPLLAAGKPVDLERQMRRGDGSDFWCHVRARVVDPNDPAGGGTIWITEDISVKRAYEEALAAAKEGAEAASRAKSAFLANMSHEIRTPLAGVLGLARLALQTADDAPRQREYLQRLLESADALGVVISDILDLSKIEAGKLPIENVDFELRSTLDSACAAYREVAAGKGLGFEVRIAAELPAHVNGDPIRLRQILGNFLSNAIKFTERGGVEVDVRANGHGSIRFAVSDTGIGVDSAARERLFEPFAQGDESTNRRFGGTGLGLSICRNLATMMGGDIGFSSVAGVGSTFWVELPLPATGRAAPATPAQSRRERPLAGLRVLLVEDNPVNMLIAEQLLLHWGAEVAQATDGRQAIAAVSDAAGGFDAVLMDVHMPGMGGHEATAELRQRYAKDELPIVALTAAALVSERDQCLAVGMNDFIAKPIEADRMVDVLLRVTAGRRAQAA